MPQQTCTDAANITAEISKSDIVAKEQPSIAESFDSVQPTADDFFDIVGTEVPMRLADHINAKTAAQVREIVDKIRARSAPK